MNSFKQNPLASIFIKASKVYMTVKTYLGGEWGRAFTVRGRQHRGKGRRGLQREATEVTRGREGKGQQGDQTQTTELRAAAKRTG